MNKIIITIFALSLTGIFLVFFAFQSVQPLKVLSISNIKYQQDEKNMSVIAINAIEDREPVKILFGGDMMFDRYIRQTGENKGYGYIISDMTELFNESDCVVANLEGPVTKNDSVSVNSEFGSPDNYRFTFDSSSVQMLKDNNFCIVNLGNNHIGNFGVEGIAQTKNFMRAGGLYYFGDTGVEDEQRYFIQDFDGVKIAFINYNQFVKNALPNALDDIQNVKDKSDFVVAYTHWGEEYKTSSRQNEQNIAHQIIDSGVDVIIGSHPHVIQEKEVYKGKTIYYSLGNFIFDQYFSEETKQGLLVQTTFDTDKDTITFEEHQVKLTPSGNTLLK
ncbi:MAG: CapA family protein [Candidatus Moraniibacteriota bacterium]|jgi:gamma-polyglutamate biosynthesis protein CapA